MEEERELTEKEKEIARLRAAEKFMKKDTGNAMCTVCSYTYKWEQGAALAPRPRGWMRWEQDQLPDNRTEGALRGRGRGCSSMQQQH